MNTLTSSAIHALIVAEVSAVYQEVSGLEDVKIRVPEQTLVHYPPAQYLRECLQSTYNNFEEVATRLGTAKAQNSFRTIWNAVAQHVLEEVLFLHIPKR